MEVLLMLKTRVVTTTSYYHISSALILKRQAKVLQQFSYSWPVK